MKLQRKTQIAIGVTLISLIVILFVTSRLFIYTHIDNQEKETVRSGVDRAISAFYEDLATLTPLARHWAKLEDADVFQKRAGSDQYQINFSDESMQLFKLNLVLIARSNSQAIYAKRFDLHSGIEVPVTDAIMNRLLAGSPLLDSSFAASGRARILLLPEGPLLIVSHFIEGQKLNDEKPGFLVLGRLLLDPEVRHLTEVTQIPITIARTDDPGIPDDMREALLSLSLRNPVQVQALGNESIAGYTILRDMYDQPALLLKVRLNRDLHQRAVISLNYFMLMLIVVGLVFGLLMLWIMNKLVLVKLRFLSSSVKQVSVTGQLSTRLQTTGQDELSDLSRAMNTMLERLESAQEETKCSEERYRDLFESSLIAKYISTREGSILLCNSTFVRMMGYASAGDAYKISAYSLYPNPTVRDNFLRRLQQEKKIEHMEYELIRQDGQQITVIENTVGVFNEFGELVQLQGSMLDITDRKFAERALKESEERFRMLYAQAPLAYQSLDKDGRFIEVNQAWLNTLGYTREEVIGHWFGDFISPSQLNLFKERFPEFLAAGEVRDAEYDLVCKDGSILTVLVHGKVGHNEQGAFKQTHCILNDITERRRAMTSLRESEEKYRSLLDASPDAIIMLDLKGTILWHNQIFSQLLHAPLYDSLVGRLALDFVYPEDHQRIRDTRDRTTIVGKLSKFEIQLKRTDETRFLAEINATPIRNAEGELTSVICIIRDITDQRQSETALTTSEERLKLALEGGNDGFWDWNIASGEVFMSAQVTSMFGYGSEAATVLFDDWKQAVDDRDVERVKSAVLDHFEGRTDGFRAEYRFHNASGELHWAYSRGRVVDRDESSNPLRMVGVVTDITARKQSEIDLQRANRALRTISDCNQALVRATDEDRLLQDICKTIVQSSEYRMAWVGYILENEEKTLYPVTFAGHEDGFLRTLKASWGDDKWGQGVMGTCVRTKQPCFVRDIATDSRYTPWRDAALQRGYGSALGLPLIAGGQTFGALCIYSETDVFDETEVLLLSELAEDLAFGIQTLRTKREHEKAEESLTESESRYRSLFNEMITGFALHEIICDSDGKPIDYRYLEVNPAFEKMTGMSREKAIGHTVREILPDIESYWIDNYGHVALTGEPMYFENYVKELGKHFETIAYSPEKGQFAVTFTEVTQRLKAEHDLKESEEKLRTLFETMTQGVLYVNTDGIIETANPAAERILGVPHDVMIGRDVGDLRWNCIHEDGTPYTKDELPAQVSLTTGKEVRNAILGVLNPRIGEHRWLCTNTVPQYKETDEKAYAVYITLEDITERKRTEQALLDSEERLDSIMSSLEDIVYSVTADTVERVYLNPAAEKIYGRPITYFYSDPLGWQKVIHPEDLAIVEKLIQEIKNEGAAEGEYRILRPDGSVRWLHDRGWLYADEAGNPVRIDGIETDITERKQAEEALRVSEERFRSIYEYSPVGIQLYANTGAFVQMNRACLDMFGIVNRDEVEKLNLFEAPTLNDELKTRLRIGEAVAFENAFDFEFIKQHKIYQTTKAGTIYLDTLITPIHAGDKRSITGYLVQLLDITERKLAEAAVRESEAFNRELIALAPDGIAYLNSKAEVVFANPAMLETIGISANNNESNPKEQLQRLTEAIHSEFGKELSRLLRGEHIRVEESKFTSLTGVKKQLNVHGSPRLNDEGEVIGAMFIFADLTAYKELQIQLRLAQKMEAIGTLAGGIAHDFNNLLTAIMGNAELALMSVEQEGKLKNQLQVVVRSAGRAAELTSQLLTFGRRRMEQPRPADLNVVLDEVGPLVRRTIDPRIELRIEKDPKLWVAMADVGQMSQVIMNLLVNARDALPNGGRITVRSENMTLYAEDLSQMTEARPGDYLCLSVSDNGIGMTVETVNRIFEPFYTTKQPGQGTGLGLAMVYGIVKGHHGWIDVESALEVGTIFRIYLPRYAGEVEIESRIISEELPRGNERILLVDDQQLVLDTGRNMLEKAGYSVVTADNGLSALDVYGKHSGKFDLVILDLSMPRMSGRETLVALMRVNPNLKVMISSGFDHNETISSLMEKGARGFVPKPYRIYQLLQSVRKILDEHPGE